MRQTFPKTRPRNSHTYHSPYIEGYLTVPRRYVNDLSDAERVDEIYRASGKQLRPNRNGNLYLQVQLSDRSGSVTAMMWNANEKIYGSFQNGDYVRIDGTAQLYNGTLQIIATQLERVEYVTVDESEFLPTGRCDVKTLTVRLKELLRSIDNVHLQSIAGCFLVDDEFLDRFTRAPAGVKIHHAYPGGLLEHVVSLMELAVAVAAHYPDLDADLLTMGAFVHDIGKIVELTSHDLAYTDEGQLIGHMVIGVGILDEKVREAEELSGEVIPYDVVLPLKHMIVSHHGEYAFGSPKLPMTLEALTLHYLDSLDSKIQNFSQLIREDLNADSSWTGYQANIGRKLFKGGNVG